MSVPFNIEIQLDSIQNGPKPNKPNNLNQLNLNSFQTGEQISIVPNLLYKFENIVSDVTLIRTSANYLMKE